MGWQARPVVLSIAAAALCLGQDAPIRTTVPLVVAPVSITDKAGKPIYGLAAEDFELLDEGKPRDVQVAQTDDGTLPPIAAVIAVQTSDLSLSALGKIRKVGALVANAIAGQDGETAVITFDNEIKTAQEFTLDAEAVTQSFEKLTPSDNGGGRMIDAVSSALDLLAARSNPRRSLIIVISESKDRGSKMKLDALKQKLGHGATIVYSLTYSAYLTPFTTKASEYQPPSSGGLLGVITETARLGKTNTIDELTSATGGQHFGFVTKSKLESALIRLSADLHSRYVLTFRPETAGTSGFHALTLCVRNHPEAIVHVRNGYWPSE